MQRFALAVIVALLTFSASGVYALAVAEPCTYEQPGDQDSSCPPTCVTCGCCAQAAEPLTLHVAGAPDIPTPDVQTIVPSLPKTQPRDILHVPKLRLA